VLLAHDTEAALQAAVELVNTAGSPDTLTRQEQVDVWYAKFLYTGRRDRDATELDELRAVRPVLRALLVADRDSAAETVNRMLAEAGAVPRLVRHDGIDWHLHAVSPDQPLVRRVLVETAMAMADVVRGDEMSRLALCADETCVGVVLDLTRNRSRRYCSTTCANRNAVAAYRARARSRPANPGL
jgi:predicted RNA-binding Zn ribbon-like protein